MKEKFLIFLLFFIIQSTFEAPVETEEYYKVDPPIYLTYPQATLSPKDSALEATLRLLRGGESEQVK